MSMGVQGKRKCCLLPFLLFPCHPKHQRIDSGRYTQSQVGEEPDVTCMYVYTGCPRKNDTLFWRAVAPLNFELGIKVGGVLELSGSQL